MYGFILVFIQFFFIFLLFLSGPLTPNNIISFILLISGLSLGISSLWAMRKSKIRIFPKVSRTARLIKTGPYATIRHPMYTAVLLIGVSMLLNDFSIWRLIIYFVLLGNQILKLQYEEKLLGEHFEEYSAYQQRTKRLIPYIY